jgi:2-iminobutanoate/2-iminopropanoate deaminase
MPRTAIDANLFPPIGPYSHAVVSGRHIYMSGTPGINPDTGLLAAMTAYGQARQALSNLISIIETAGGTECDLVALQVHLVNVDDFTEMNRAFDELLTPPYPARTVFCTPALPKAGALLTISGTAVLSGADRPLSTCFAESN